MSLLTPTTTAQASEAERVRTAILSLSRRTFSEMVDTQRSGIDLLWNGQASGLHSLTPQQVCDALGTDAGRVFAFHGRLTECLLDQAAVDGATVALKYPTHNFTVNENGTVTIGTGPYTP
jgi:hypothetical protein